jgi:hypothetical protein
MNIGRKFQFKEIIRIPIGRNKNFIVSLRSDDRFSITQVIQAETDDNSYDMFVQNAIVVSKSLILNMLYALAWTVLRMNNDEDLQESDRTFIKKLKEIFDERAVLHIAEQTKKRPGDFCGQTYANYRQSEAGR